MTLEDCHRSNSRKDRARQLRREMTLPERSFWYALRDRRLAAWKFGRQSPIGPYIVDFFCHAAGLCSRLTGAVMTTGTRRTGHDRLSLKLRGLRVLRVSNDDVFYHMEDVLNAILARSLGMESPPHPAFGHPLPEGEGGLMRSRP